MIKIMRCAETEINNYFHLEVEVTPVEWLQIAN
jgi:hypothetical protein